MQLFVAHHLFLCSVLLICSWYMPPWFLSFRYSAKCGHVQQGGCSIFKRCRILSIIFMACDWFFVAHDSFVRGRWFHFWLTYCLISIKHSARYVRDSFCHCTWFVCSRKMIWFFGWRIVWFQFKQREMCTRLARRLLDIQTLPYIVVENPNIQKARRYTYICIHFHVNTYIYIYIFTYVCLYVVVYRGGTPKYSKGGARFLSISIIVYIDVRVCACVCVNMYMCMCEYVYVYIIICTWKPNCSKSQAFFFYVRFKRWCSLSLYNCRCEHSFLCVL